MKPILLYTFMLLAGNLLSQINNGLIVHFPFNNDLDDISSNAIIATNTGATFGDDRNGATNSAIACDGNGYISSSDDALKIQFPLSVSYWVKFNSIGQVQFPFKTDNVFDDYHGVWMNSIPSGGMTLSIGGGNGSANTTNQRYYTTDITPLTAGIWHHVVGIVRDYNDMDIYIDCIQANGSYGGSGSTTVAYSVNGDLRIGSSIGSGASPSDKILDGSIDQFAAWNRELTPSEITFLCDTNNPLSVDELDESPKELVKIIDLTGRETEYQTNTVLIYIYSDGSTERVFKME